MRDIQPFARRFGVARVLVTGRWGPDRHASLRDAALSGLSERDAAILRMLYAWPIGKRVVGARRD